MQPRVIFQCGQSLHTVRSHLIPHEIERQGTQHGRLFEPRKRPRTCVPHLIAAHQPKGQGTQCRSLLQGSKRLCTSVAQVVAHEIKGQSVQRRGVPQCREAPRPSNTQSVELEIEGQGLQHRGLVERRKALTRDKESRSGSREKRVGGTTGGLRTATLRHARAQADLFGGVGPTRASFEQGGGGREGVLDPELGVPKMA